MTEAPTFSVARFIVTGLSYFFIFMFLHACILTPPYVLLLLMAQEKSEGVTFREGEELPETVPFLDFIDEVCLLFDSLGSAGFSFVRSDLATKSGIIRRIHDSNPQDNHTLFQAPTPFYFPIYTTLHIFYFS